MSNGVTVWDLLNAGSSYLGAIPYIGSAGTPIVSYGDFYFADSTKRLYIGNGGDFSQTDTLNISKEGSSYYPSPVQNLATGLVAGWKTITSRGVAGVPTTSLNGDMIGEYAGYAYTTPVATAGFNRMAGMDVWVKGASTTNPGGQGKLFAKPNAGAAVTYMLQWDDVSVQPIADGLTALGAAGNGFGKIYQVSSGSAAPIAGSQILNKIRGKIQIAAGQQTIVLTNSWIGADDVVMLQVISDDATAKSAVAVPIAAGSVTIKSNAVTTANTNIFFEVKAMS